MLDAWTSAPAVDDRALPDPDPAHARRLAWSTAIFSLATGISRILGSRPRDRRALLLRCGAINAFTVAFLIPNTIRALVADAALSSAFVPVFSELLEKGERKRAWRVASTLFWLMLLGLGGLTALFIVISRRSVLRAFGVRRDRSRSGSPGCSFRSSSFSASPGSSSGS